MSDDWEQSFADIGAFWYHDGNPRRPYVELTNLKDGHRQIINGYFNGAIVQKHAWLFGRACVELSGMLSSIHEPDSDGSQAIYVIAVEKGGTALSQRLGEALMCGSGFAEKIDEHTVRFERFTFEEDAVFIPGEDTVTSGGTVGRLLIAARRAAPRCRFHPFILAFCNRSGKSEIWFDGSPYQVLALVDRAMQTWNLGENPFTPDGRELVEPVKAKTHWAELTRSYD